MILDLILCRFMHWTYAELLELPVDVYRLLVAELPRIANPAGE